MRKYLFYTSLLAILFGITYCSDYTSTVSEPPKAETHPEGWLLKSSDNFHGKYLAAKNFKYDNCISCHGSDFSGGITSVSCNDCHIVHPEGFADSTIALPHFEFLRNNGFKLEECRVCHQEDYSGGLTGVSCMQCHVSAEGPEACNTCHGDFNDVTKPYPPRAVNGSKDETYAGVGAHIHHLTDSGIRVAAECVDCHKVPENYADEGHIDDTPGAELNFSLFVSPNGEAEYNHENNLCSNVYCHGNFVFLKDSAGSNSWIYTDSVMVGENFSPQWNRLDETQAECGSCHLLPPRGHLDAGNDPDASTCATCHIGIVSAEGMIIDSLKHINGKPNVFGN